MLTPERLREVLEYAPKTGVFIWRVSQGRVRAGTVAGRIDAKGYRVIGIDGQRYLAHRLAWMYENGVWPVCQLDHRFGNAEGDQMSNLREATPAQNMQNQRRPHRNNKARALGVSVRAGRRPEARIAVGGENFTLGRYDTVEEAHAAYVSAKARMHPFSTLGKSSE